MKSEPRKCPNGHRAMHRSFIKQTFDKKTAWTPISWQYCPDCKMMLPD